MSAYTIKPSDMKKMMFLFLAFSLTAMTVKAQDEESKKGFKKENLFTGGGITLAFSSRITTLGANPIFGYKIANWLDAGVAFNYVYTGIRDYQQFDDKLRQSVYGPGAFVRLYPARFLFVQGQFEHNFSKLKYIYPGGGLTERSKAEANSFLVGGGIAQGRRPGSNTFFYLSLLVDVIKDINSPYVNVAIDPSDPSNQRVTTRPIFRAGVNIGLFEGRR